MVDLSRYATEHPAPLRDEASAPFFEAAAQDRLSLPRCESCDTWLAPNQVACPRCLNERLAWTRVSGRGRIFSWTVIHNSPEAFRREVPYVIAEIELEEGPHLETRLLGISKDGVSLGMEVAAAYCHPPHGDSYPVFLPVESGGDARL
jgi:uncharacterized OB-fold protein